MSTFISTQAMGFQEFLSNGVDPRTGQYTLRIQLPDIIDKALEGAGISLSLQFNPLNKRNSGFGLGWHPNLTEFGVDRVLSLHTGESFKQTATTPDGTPVFPENKLKTFVFEAPGDGTFRVIHRSGEVEVLRTIGSGINQVAVPHRIYAANGKYLDLAYENVAGWQVLKSVSDPDATLLLIERNLDSSVVQIHIHPDAAPDGGPLATYTLRVNQQQLRKVALPNDEGCWNIEYEMIRDVLCVKRLDTPTGGRETLEYNDAGHILPSHPGEPAKPNLPRVTRHLTDPRFDQPVIDVRYGYNSDATNIGHNFHGNGADVSVVPGLDPLHTASATYRYGTTVTLMGEVLVNGQKTLAPVRSVARTYSRFHSLLEEITTQGNCVKREQTTYYATSQPFGDQPPQYQLPMQVKTSWHLIDNSSAYREETITSRYDIHGNLVEKTEADGVKTLYTFYDKDGEPGCPADAYGFQRHLKSQRVIPSPHGQPGAPTLQTDFTFQALEAVPGSGLPERLVQASETLLHIDAPGGTPVQMKQLFTTFYTDPADTLTFGRRCRDCDTINGKTTTIEYSYRRVDSVMAGERVLETTSTHIGFDYVAGSNETKKSVWVQQSLLTGLTVLTCDDNNVPTVTRHDALRRITSQTVAPGDTEFEATRTYEYGLVANAGEQAWQRVTDTKGVKILTRLDGVGRVIYQGRNEPDRPGGDDGYLQTYSAQYNAMGDMTEQTSFDWHGETPLALTSRMEYDQWGELWRTIGPDGLTIVNEQSPFGKEGPMITSWLESAEQPPKIKGLNITEHNRFGEPASVTRYDTQPLNRQLAASTLASPLNVYDLLASALRQNQLPVIDTTEYVYDGMGTCIEQRELLGSLERTSTFSYDTWGRLVQATQPDQTVVTREFADHTREELPIRLQVTPANAGDPTVTLGEQTFDGLMRQTHLTVGGRVEQYHYEGNKLQLNKRITPAKREYNYRYEDRLGDQPTEIITPEGVMSYGYDSRTATLQSSDSKDGNQRFAYSASGQLLSETWLDSNGSSHEIKYESSMIGLPLSRSQSKGPDTFYEYDEFARTKVVTQGDLRAQFEYDRLGQQYRTTTTNRHDFSSLVTELEFDSQGRETLRTLSLTGEPVRTIRQTWYPDDQLHTRELSISGQSQLRETYTYDLQSRLIIHQCAGPALPKDHFDNPYNRQTFQYDSLDNVLRCQTQFANGQNDVATFTYKLDGSCQLISVTHTNIAGGYPALQTFTYDDDGNMLNDEHGQRLEYDQLGRLMHVKDAADTEVLTAYRYNGHNELIGVRHRTESETLRFYQGYSLSHTVQDDLHTHYLSSGGVPLGQQQFNASVIDHEQTMLLLTDASPSVIGESLRGELHTASYTAYGVRSADDEAMETLLAFNAEASERQGWSMLGRGYRAYNPVLMRFHTPDSVSPFGAGGLNPYTYCQGDPINLRDPSGHYNSTRGHDWDADRLPDPEPQPKPSGLQKWLPLGGAIVGALFAAIFVPWTAPIAFTSVAVGLTAVAKIAGIAAAAIAIVAVGFIAVGIETGDQGKQDVGAWLGIVASILGAFSAIVGGYTAWLKAKAEKAANLLSKFATRNFRQGGAKGASSVPGAGLSGAHTAPPRLGLKGTQSWNGIIRAPRARKMLTMDIYVEPGGPPATGATGAGGATGNPMAAADALNTAPPPPPPRSPVIRTPAGGASGTQGSVPQSAGIPARDIRQPGYESISPAAQIEKAKNKRTVFTPGSGLGV